MTTSTTTTTTVTMMARALGPALSPAAGGLDQWEELLWAGLDQWEGLEGPRQGLDGAVWKISMPICVQSFAGFVCGRDLQQWRRQSLPPDKYLTGKIYLQ